MMASKARLFGDDGVLNEIMEAPTPFEYKNLGRKIRGFVANVWDANKYDIVVKGNKAKFSHNPAKKEFLLSTGDSIIAEASSMRRSVAPGSLSRITSSTARSSFGSMSS